MKKGLLIALGVAALGLIGINYYNHHKISVDLVDYINKKVSVSWMGNVINFTYGTPGQGMTNGPYRFEVSGANNIIQATLFKNGKPVRQENISLVK